MPLPTPNLDDRRFQDIVDEAKSLIPLYCPEWTDHNVSDPGVALIELFAWMTDMLLYRVNQTPDKMYVKFLELIGVTLDADRSDEGSWAAHDLAQMDLPGQRMAIFAGTPNPGDAFYLAFRGDHS